MMWWWGSGTSWVGWLFMSLMMLIFWGGLVALIVWGFRTAARASDHSRDAEAVLRERFARGEIDRDEFEERLAILRGQSHAA